MKMWYFKTTFNFLLLGWKSIIPDNYLKISYQWLPGSSPGWARVFEAGTASATYLIIYS